MFKEISIGSRKVPMLATEQLRFIISRSFKRTLSQMYIMRRTESEK